MAAFRVCYVKWVRRPELHVTEGPSFDVYPKGEGRLIRCINVLLRSADIQSLKDEMLLHESEKDAQLQRVVIRYAIRRIEQELRQDLFPNPPSDETDNLFITRDDHPILRQMLQEKTCEYQIQEGRDLLCSAASETDKTLRGRIGLRFIAPTSRSICHTCTMPDTDYLCSHFLHPEVLGYSDRGIGFSYARPFTRNQHHGRLPAEWAKFSDPHFQEAHDKLIKARHQYIAHSDEEIREVLIFPPGAPIGETGLRAGDLSLTVRTLGFPLSWFPSIRDLCSDLGGRMDARVNSLLAELYAGLELPVEAFPLTFNEGL